MTEDEVVLKVNTPAAELARTSSAEALGEPHDYAIRSVDLTYEYAPGVGAIGLDLAVPVGCVYGFLGPNGAGKSTAIRMLSGLVRPKRGTVSVLGLDPWQQSSQLHARIGVLTSDQVAPRHHTGQSLLRLIGKMRGEPQLVTHGQSIADRLSLDLTKAAHTLSLGNRQKLGLVLALAHRPDVVILDEPTSGLDPLLQREINTLIRELAENGSTVMLSSHSLGDVEAVADHVGFIRDARLVEQLPLAMLAQRAVRQVRFRFANDFGVADVSDGYGFARVPGVDSVTTSADGEVCIRYQGPVAEILRRAGELGAETVEAHPVQLEEVFLSLYRGQEGDMP